MDYQRGIWELYTEKSIEDNQPEILSFNLDELSNRKQRELEKYVNMKRAHLEKSRNLKTEKLRVKPEKKREKEKQKQKKLLQHLVKQNIVDSSDGQ